MELEPLSEEAALDYVEQDSGIQDARRLDWIVETASVADAPLYLQITRQLYKKGLLEHLARTGTRFDTRKVDRSACAGACFMRGEEVSPTATCARKFLLDRKIALTPSKWFRRLACVGLLKDTLEVRFEDLIGKIGTDEYQASGSRAEPGQDTICPGIPRYLGTR